MNNRILVVDDDPAFGAVLTRSLSRRGFQARTAGNVDDALALATDWKPARVVLDLNLGGQSGLSLIGPLRDTVADCRIVVLTGYASIATAVEAIKRGAMHYLTKPVDVDAIVRAFSGEGNQLPDEFDDMAPLSVGRVEWEHIQRVLQENDGNISATARALRMHRRTLQRKLAKRPEKS